MGAKTLFGLLAIVYCLAISVFASDAGVSQHLDPGNSIERPTCMKWKRINATAQLGVTSRQHHLTWSNHDGSNIYLVGGCSETGDFIKTKSGTFVGNCKKFIPQASVLDTVTQRWSHLTIFNQDDKVITLETSGAAFAHDVRSDSILFFGGQNNLGSSRSLHILSPIIADPDSTDGLKGFKVYPMETSGQVPPALRDATMTIIGPYLYLFGGFNMDTYKPSSDLYVADMEGPRAFIWRKITLNVRPSARYGHTMTALPSYGSQTSFIIYGGSDGVNTLNDVWSLSGTGPDLVWKRLQANLHASSVQPSGRLYHSAALSSDGVSSKVIVYGGCDYKLRNCFDTVDILDVNTWEWQLVPPSLAASAFPTTAAPISAISDIDEELIAARSRYPQARNAAIMITIPDKTIKQRMAKVQERNREKLYALKATGHNITLEDELKYGAKYTFEDSFVRGTDLAIIGGCIGKYCDKRNSRVISVLETDSICPISCAIGRGEYVEESGAGVDLGLDIGREDLSYKPAYCKCKPGTFGKFCEYTHKCPNGCSGNGECKAEEDTLGGHVMFCQCHEGFWGLDCSLQTCPNNCNGRGVCTPGPDKLHITSTKTVDPKTNIFDVTTPDTVRNTHCKCRKGYYGEDCGLVLSTTMSTRCPKDCSGHGICGNDGVCQCSSGFTGHDCSKQCPGLCSNNGICVLGDAKLQEQQFEAMLLNKNTNNHLKGNATHDGKNTLITSSNPNGLFMDPSNYIGVGDDPVCKCKSGKTGKDCSLPSCAHNCNGRGTCNPDTGACTCEQGWGGEFCNINTDCSGHGKYVLKNITVPSPYKTLAPKVITIGECQCDQGWGNPICSQKVFCPNQCTNNGECILTPPASELTTLLQRPVGKDIFKGQTLGSVISTIDSPEAQLSELLMFNNNDGHSLLDMSLMDFSENNMHNQNTKIYTNLEIEGMCACRPGWRGSDCSKRECSVQCITGRGECNEMGQCDCYPGYSGPDCSLTVPCMNNCTSAFNGQCNDNSLCTCKPGWTGPDCSQRSCPKDCSGNGKCDTDTKVCQCDPGYSGPDCGTKCPNKCNGKGICVDGQCQCDPGYTGADCNTLVECPRNAFIHPDLDCSGHGTCFRPSRKCICEPGYTGKDCSQDDGSCGAGSCGAHGTCNHGQCFCDIGWSGKHCELQNQCPQNCNQRGFCVYGTCHCFAGFEGESCDRPIMDENCKNNCSGYGFCRDGKCTCIEGYTGEDCSEPLGFCKDNDCSGNGVCQFDKCVCNPDFYGDKCQHSGCKSCDEGKGVCVLGECQCLPGFKGADCSEEDTCLNYCSGHGVCILGTCACLPGYQGKDCSELILKPTAVTPGTPPKPSTEDKCPNDCSNNGVCQLGKCFCIDGYTGEDCSHVVENSCPNNCGGEAPTYDQRGICRFGKCYCKIGYTGAACETVLTCPDTCSQNGICFHGKCFCAPGYTGADCQTKLSQQEIDKLYSAEILPNYPQFPENTAKVSMYPPNDTNTFLTLQKVAELEKLKALAATGSTKPVKLPPTKPAATTTNTKPSAKPSTTTFLQLEESFEEHEQVDGSVSEQAYDQDHEETHGTTTTSENTQDQDKNMLEKNKVIIAENDKPRRKEKTCALVGGCVHGICVNELCVCQPGYAGLQCEHEAITPDWKKCPNDCGRKGTCIEGRCYCDLGYTGVDCTTKTSVPCPLDCSGHGICHHGKCYCEPGFEGVTCSVLKQCEPKCGVHGVCFRGQCVCAKGFKGPQCNEVDKNISEEVRRTIYAGDKDFALLRLSNKALEDPNEQNTFIASLKIAEPSKPELPKELDNEVNKAIEVASNAHSFIDVGEDIVQELKKVSDEHAFACDGGCGTHGRCLRGRCYCEPYYTGALCELRVDEKVIQDIESIREAGMLATPESNTNKKQISPLLIATISFTIGVIAVAVMRKMQKSQTQKAD